YQFVPCGFLSNSWKNTCRFVRKNKTAIIIGAATIIAVVLTGTAIKAHKKRQLSHSITPEPTSSESPSESSTQTQETTVEQISAEFKSKLASTNPELISNPQEPNTEKIREYSSVITHQLTDSNTDQFSRLARLSSAPHADSVTIDDKFGTDLAGDLLIAPEMHPDALAHHIVGQKALEQGNHSQAFQAFDKAIKADPLTPLNYLSRGYANNLLGKTTAAQEDFQQFKDRSAITFTSGCQIAYHFTKGLKNGAFESGTQLLHLAGDIVTHPIHTTQQVYNALSHLTKLVYTKQWTELGTALAPEVKLLIEEWNDLPDTVRGERAGYILGKYGGDILIPGAAAKVVAKGTRAAKQLAIASRSFKNAERLLAFEAGVGIEGKVAETLQIAEKAATKSEQLGCKVKPLKQASKTKAQASKIRSYEEILKDPRMVESMQLFGNAARELKKYQGMYMSELEIRTIIHKCGIRTYPRPKGVPKDYRVQLSNKPGGMKYVHPNDTGTYVRVMPGKPHSPHPAQQKPYVVQVKNGKAIDIDGKLVGLRDAKAHIPLEEFIYRE
ncbi:MAG TPA: hypothetical protein PLO43_04910, partial [Chlamydiales bacterium]|nr:hypothetical protein [Chlamydiales bacterium]